MLLPQGCTATHLKVLLFRHHVVVLLFVVEAGLRKLSAQEVRRDGHVQAFAAQEDLVHLRQGPDGISGEQNGLRVSLLGSVPGLVQDYGWG